MSSYYKYTTPSVRDTPQLRCLEPIAPRIRDLQTQITDLEWEGMAPEKMSDLLNELQRLQEMEAKGEIYVPTF